MEYSILSDGEQKEIAMKGQFTFADSIPFQQIVAILDAKKTLALSIDFRDIEFIDSAGLGMLLLLRDECNKRHIHLNIHSARGQVQKIFALSRFDQLFTLGNKAC